MPLLSKPPNPTYAKPLVFSLGNHERGFERLLLETPGGYRPVVALVGWLQGRKEAEEAQQKGLRLCGMADDAEKAVKEAKQAGVEYKALEDALAKVEEDLVNAKQLFLQKKEAYLRKWQTEIRTKMENGITI